MNKHFSLKPMLAVGLIAAGLAFGCSPGASGNSNTNVGAVNAPAAAGQTAPNNDLADMQKRLDDLTTRLVAQETAVKETQKDQSATVLNGMSVNRTLQLALPPVGSIMPWAGEGEPPAASGWVVCDGRKIDIEDHKEFEKVVTSANWGIGAIDGKIRVPDLRGMFLRGAGRPGDSGHTVGTEQSYATALPSGNSPFRTNDAGSHDHKGRTGPGGKHTPTMRESGEHTHAVKWSFRWVTHERDKPEDHEDLTLVPLQNNKRIFRETTLGGDGSHSHPIDEVPDHDHPISPDGSHHHIVDGGGDAETRPVNRAVTWIIRVK